MEDYEKKINLECPVCRNHFSQLVIEEKLLDSKCGCGTQIMMEETMFDQVIIQWSIEAKEYVKLDIGRRDYSVIGFDGK